MKKALFYILLLVQLNCIPASAQNPSWDLSEYLSIAREGVKWVNEKVIIDHSDTTHYYYTYEFKGKQCLDPQFPDERQFPACHYYIGTEIDENNDSVISLIHDDGWWIDCYNNWAYDKVCKENRNLMKRSFLLGMGDGEFLYHIKYKEPDQQVDSYIEQQRRPHFLTKNNLIVANPVNIEGYSCQRLAYINENGDTLAYIVHGIGFDSRDMGDLLTPFTQPLDPWDGYQEYCGLSHVVKDGKIIYRGMRYREGAFDGIDEVVAEQPRRPLDDNYYNLMGQPVGKNLPTAPGIYIHHGQKICVSRTR